jgi:hypothetical protein
VTTDLAIWMYRRLACGVLAELLLPLLLTDAAVHPFPKQVGVAGKRRVRPELLWSCGSTWA